MLGLMSAKRIVIYMPDALVDSLDRFTAVSPQSRSELICAAVQRCLAEGPGAAVESASPDEACFDRGAEMMQSCRVQPADFTTPSGVAAPPKIQAEANG